MRNRINVMLSRAQHGESRAFYLGSACNTLLFVWMCDGPNPTNLTLSSIQFVGMYILGNVTTLEANTDRSPMWPQVLNQLRGAGRLGDVLQVRGN